jgi:hypothetical protein
LLIAISLCTSFPATTSCSSAESRIATKSHARLDELFCTISTPENNPGSESDPVLERPESIDCVWCMWLRMAKFIHSFDDRLPSRFWGPSMAAQELTLLELQK